MLTVERIGSFEKFVERALTAADNSRSSSHRNEPREGWDFGAGWDGTIELAKRGWPEGTKAVDDMTMRIGERLVTKLLREEWNHDVMGVEIDVATMLSGEPECWLTPEEAPIECDGRGYGVVRIVLGGTASCSIDATVLRRKGAAAAALAILLERAGRAVAIDLAYSNQMGGHELLHLVTLKEPGQPIDTDRIAFALTHPGCFRRLMFAVWETLPESTRRTFRLIRGQGYGSARDCVAPEHRGDIYLPTSVRGEPQWDSEDATTKWVEGHLRAYGVLKD